MIWPDWATNPVESRRLRTIVDPTPSMSVAQKLKLDISTIYHIPAVTLAVHVRLVPFCSPKLTIGVDESEKSETLPVVKKSEYKRQEKEMKSWARL